MDVVLSEAALRFLLRAKAAFWSPLVTLDFSPLAGCAAMVRFLVGPAQGHVMGYHLGILELMVSNDLSSPTLRPPKKNEVLGFGYGRTALCRLPTKGEVI